MTNVSRVRAALILAAKNFLTDNDSIKTTEGLIEGLPVIDLAAIGWENRNLDAEGLPVWASVFYVPNSPIARTMGPGGYNEINGFMQIDLTVAADSGEAALIAWQEKSELFFHAGRVFRYNGQGVIVSQSGMGRARLISNTFRRSTTINFRAHLKRPQLITVSEALWGDDSELVWQPGNELLWE